jgi:MFS family permease
MITQSVGAYYSFFAADRLNVPEAMVLPLMAIGPLVGVFVAPIGGYLSDRIGPVPVVAASALLAAPLLYAVSRVTVLPAFIVVLVVGGIINMARAPSSEAFFVTSIPVHRRATILGIYFFAGMELAGLMTPLAGRLIDSLGFGPVLVGAAISQVVLTVVCLVLLRNSGMLSRKARSA